MSLEMQEIVKKLEKLEKDVGTLHEKIDRILTEHMTGEDEALLEKARAEHKRGETTSLEELKKELGA